MSESIAFTMLEGYLDQRKGETRSEGKQAIAATAVD